MAVQLPAMSKPEKKDAAGKKTKTKPRLTAVMEPADRNRIRFVALRLGESVETLAARWLLERCALEEKRLGIK